MSSGQPVRLGNEFLKNVGANGTANITIAQDLMIHVQASATSNHPANFAAVCGQNDKDDPTPGRADYCDDTLEIYAHSGFVYAWGTWPRLRTKRTKFVGPGTTIVARLKPITDPADDPEDSVDHQGFLLDPVAGQRLRMWRYVDAPPSFPSADPAVSGGYTIECQANPPADAGNIYYVAPGQEAYFTVDPANNVTVTKEPAKAGGFEWNGADKVLIDDNIKTRAAQIIK